MNASSYESEESRQLWQATGERLRQAVQDQRVDNSSAYLVTLGQEAISVDAVEFRILQFLAAEPYKAFTPQRIAAAVSTTNEPVTEETLRDYVLSLREKLGMFADYIQSVPYIGYRFKA